MAEGRTEGTDAAPRLSHSAPWTKTAELAALGHRDPFTDTPWHHHAPVHVGPSDRTPDRYPVQGQTYQRMAASTTKLTMMRKLSYQPG